MQPVQSAFGFYKSDKTKAGLTPVGKKIKGKYDDLCNKKKNKKLKKSALAVAKKKPTKSEGLSNDWPVRRVQFDDLKKNKVKTSEGPSEDSRESGKNVFQHLLSSCDVDKFMRYRSLESTSYKL